MLVLSFDIMTALLAQFLQCLHFAAFLHYWGLCCAGRSPTATGDAAQQQLLSGILGVLGLNGTAAPNSTSPAGSPSV